MRAPFLGSVQVSMATSCTFSPATTAQSGQEGSGVAVSFLGKASVASRQGGGSVTPQHTSWAQGYNCKVF